MDILWDRGRATVGEVVDAVPGGRPLAYNTVLTLLRIMEQKGYLRHEKKGRAFVYVPIVDRERARRHAVKHLLARFFQDSPGLLALNILEHERVDPEELVRLKSLIAESEEGAGS